MAHEKTFDLTKASGQWRRYAQNLRREIAQLEHGATHLAHSNERTQVGGAVVALLAAAKQAEDLAELLEKAGA